MCHSCNMPYTLRQGVNSHSNQSRPPRYAPFTSGSSTHLHSTAARIFAYILRAVVQPSISHLMGRPRLHIACGSTNACFKTERQKQRNNHIHERVARHNKAIRLLVAQREFSRITNRRNQKFIDARHNVVRLLQTEQVNVRFQMYSSPLLAVFRAVCRFSTKPLRVIEAP